MKIADFRNFSIIRSTVEHEQDYRKYRQALREDFQYRCGYCNTSEKILDLVPFHIDHFIPRKVFENGRPDLETEYSNLIWSCPKCNIAKGSQFQGSLEQGSEANELFYKPDKTDFNSIFYRNEYGGIGSSDGKGIEMIRRLKLYRKFYATVWILELLESTIKRVEEKVEHAGVAKDQGLSEELLRLYREKDYYRSLLSDLYGHENG